MLSAPIRLLTRASAGARARSAAPVSEVWAVLSHPARWPEFEPLVQLVAGPEGELAADIEVEPGQHLRALLRVSPFELPIVVDHVVTRSSLVVTAKLLPGLAEEVEHLVIPSASGGSLLTVRITLHGPLAVPALLPRWLLRVLTVRLLARAAEGELRTGERQVSSVA
jgi:hypothetical protein